MENLELLKGVVSAETYAKLEEETKDSTIRLGDLSTGNFVSKEKYTGLEQQLQKVNTALSDKTKEYDTLKEKAGDNESLKSEIERLKGEHKNELDNLTTSYNEQLKKSAVVTEISTKYRPKDVNDILPHIDMAKVTIEKDSITGLVEQLDPLTESKAYLFEEQKKKKGGLDHDDIDDGGDAMLRAAFGLKTKTN